MRMARRVSGRPLMVFGCLLAVLAATGVSSISRGEPGVLARGPGTPPAQPPPEKGTFVDRMTIHGQQARALYITYPYLHQFKTAGVARLVKRSHLDAAVIDLKDDQ